MMFVFAKVSNFNGNKWGMQGPTRVTAALRLFCKNINSRTSWPDGKNAKDAIDCIPRNGRTDQGLTVLNSKYGYPIHYTNWGLLLNEGRARQVLQQLRKDKTFALHVWHYLSKKHFEHITSPHTPYAQIISRHCPKIYKECYFTSNYNKTTPKEMAP